MLAVEAGEVTSGLRRAGAPAYRVGMGFVDDAPRQHFETRAQWRAWLEENHASSSGVFFVYWRAGTGKPAIGYEAMVEEALCFGWIDSRQSKLDQERTMLWFTPRKRGSGWARPNKLRVEKMVAAGLMHPSGLAVVHAAQQDGSWDVLDSVEDLEIPADLAEALAAHAGAAAEFDAFPRSVRRGILEWITTAKTAGTRSRRIAETAQKAARGERANQWTRKPSPRDAGSARR